MMLPDVIPIAIILADVIPVSVVLTKKGHFYPDAISLLAQFEHVIIWGSQ